MPVLEPDVCVIGSGPGGYVAALRAAQLGKQVAVVERENAGGVCLNVGCIPSKALITAGSLYHRMRHAEAMGIHVEGARLDLAELQAWKRKVVAKLTGGVKSLLKMRKARWIPGEARLRDAGTIEVQGKDGDTLLLRPRAAILATGSEPATIPGFAFDGERILDSTGALALEALPERLVVIGGGYIGLEIGMFYAKAGSKVTIIEMTGGLLPGSDPELVGVVAKRCRKLGMELHFEARASGWKETRKGLEITVERKGEKPATILGDRVLVATGRRPVTRGLGLEAAGLTTDAQGFIPAGADRRTAVRNLWAIGDVAGQPMLAHKASHEGLMVAGMLAGETEGWDDRVVPACIFTDPEIATAGMTEDDARRAGATPITGKFPFAASGRALTLGGPAEGFVKIVADRDSRVVLGVHIVGHEAAELISEGALAVEMRATVEDLARTIHPHPTLPESIMEAAEATMGRAVHIFQR